MSKAITKILFIESDETTFQFRKCMADALFTLPPMELMHAVDAAEALSKIENDGVDVLVIDDDLEDELKLLMDSLEPKTLPIVLQTDLSSKEPQSQITCIPKEESIASIHKTLKVATEVCAKSAEENTLH